MLREREALDFVCGYPYLNGLTLVIPCCHCEFGYDIAMLIFINTYFEK